MGASPNTKQQIGTLTWNANGTLQILQINDTANTPNTQTCTYGYDDLERVASATCGTGGWGQTFTYDAYGNITKTVPPDYTGVSFSPGYGCCNHAYGFGYDGGSGYNGGDGNVTNDGVNTYTYSVYGRPATVNSTTAVYDASLRLVEVQSGSGNTQIVYAPDGYKFAYMNGQAVTTYVVPLTAGVQTVYTAANPAAPVYWMHSDWLGSVRLASSPGQTTLADQAYAPFGEDYAVYFHGGSHDFTGQTQDVTSGLYDFTFRQYSPSQGRWLVPDPAGRAAVDITNPQTWNRYAYLSNNPLNKVDPKGLFCVVDYGGDGSGCALGSPESIFGGGGSYDASAGTGPGGVFGAVSGQGSGGLLGNIEASQDAFGEQLQAIASISAAADLVLSILNGNNPCTANLFNPSANDLMPLSLYSPTPAGDIFATDTIVPNFNSGFTSVIATSEENTGWESTITVNVNSPWTSSMQPGNPGPVYTQGPFLSTSLGGHAVALLHEFGHTIGSLPPDNPNSGSGVSSSANTATVVQNCATTIQSYE